VTSMAAVTTMAATEQATQQAAATMAAAAAMTAVATAAAAAEQAAAAVAAKAAATTVAAVAAPATASLGRVAVHRQGGEPNHGQEQGDAQNQDAIHLDLQVRNRVTGSRTSAVSVRAAQPTASAGPSRGREDRPLRVGCPVAKPPERRATRAVVRW
jgi:hypothetical protein